MSSGTQKSVKGEDNGSEDWHPIVDVAAGYIVKNRFVLALICVVLFAVVAVGFKNFGLAADYKSFFDKDNPQMLAFEAMQASYSKNDSILLVIAPEDGEVFQRKYLEMIEKLTERAWHTPYAKRVDSLANFQHTSVEGDDLDVQYLFEDASDMSDEEIKRRGQIAIDEPELVNRIISASGAVTAININTNMPGINKSTEVPETVAFVRALVDEFKQAYPQVNFHLVGSVMLNNSFPEASKKNNKLYGIMFGLMVLLLVLIYRNTLGALTTLLVMILSAASGMAVIAWTGVKLTPVGMSAPIMILTLAVAHCVHLFSSFYSEVKSGKDRLFALRNALKANIFPIVLASLTTAVGFLSQNFSESPPYRVLGNMVAVGVIFSAIYSLLFLPAIMSLLPVNPDKVRGYSIAMSGYADFLIKYRKFMLTSSILVTVVLSLFVTNNVLDDNNIEHFSEEFEFRRDVEFVNKNLTGVKSIEYSIPASGKQGVTDPEYLRKLDEFTAWLRTQPLVVHVSSFSDTMKRLNRDMNNGDPEFYRIADSKELAAQYLLLYEMFLPMGLDLTNRVKMDRSATQVIVTAEKASNRQLYNLDVAAQKWLRENAPSYMWTEGLGQNMMFVHIEMGNLESLLKGVFLGLIVISGILMLVFKSIKIGIISLVPNLFPALVAFGIWGIFVGKVGLGLSLVMGMTLGIVVDDTVHFLFKYLKGRKELKLSSQDSVRFAFESCGSALVITTIVLAAGFMVLSLSTFAVSADMGLMTAITLVVALLIDVVLLPTLLMIFDSGVSEVTKEASPVQETNEAISNVA